MGDLPYRPSTTDPAKAIDRTIGTRQPGEEYSIPHKTSLRAIVWWESRKPPLEREKKTEIFKALSYKPRQAYEALAEQIEGTETARRVQNDPSRDPHIRRGPKSKISPVQADQMADLMETAGWEGHTLTWEQLGENAGLENCSIRLIKDCMKERGWHVCKVCKKPYCSPDLKDRRKKWAKDMLEKYPDKEDWRKVRFSDECHGSFGPQGSINIIRKAGMRHHPDCVLEIDKPKKRSRKRKRGQDPESEEEEEDPTKGLKVHWWAAIGYNFKSDITFYHVPMKNNRKLTHDVYINNILEPIVKPWLDDGQDFVLEEDGDPGHGYSSMNTDNKVVRWKRDNGLITYKNCAESPDLSPLENNWMFPKNKLGTMGHWDIDTLKELVLEGWEELSQETINSWVDSMPEKLQKVIDYKGKRTGY